MNNLIARVQELEEALDDPAYVWNRLREAWRNAEEDDLAFLRLLFRLAHEAFFEGLGKKIRRMLRREREKVQLDRVQEMDRASMRWLSKQPGTTLEQRADLINEFWQSLETKTLIRSKIVFCCYQAR